MAVTDRLPVVVGGESATSRFADRMVESEALRLSLEVHRHAIDSDVIDGRVMNNLRRGLRDIFDDDKVAESWTELGRVTDPEGPS